VTEDDGWLLVSVSTAGAAATLRVHVWRKLRSLGALYLQQSVCVLPARAEVVRQVRLLADRVHHQGGSARVLRIELTDPDEQARVVAEMSAARDAEYAEVLDRLPAFRSELATERARGRPSYVEVEESEADLERFRSWLSKIAKRDYFGAPAASTARQAAEAAAAELAEFEAEALNIEAPAEPATAAAPPEVEKTGQRLRVVDEL